MKLCFDATRFGTGLEGAIELAAAKGIPSIEYSFEPFETTTKGSLKAEEKKHLKELNELARDKGVQIACLNLEYLHTPGDRKSARRFQGMMAKLAKVANLVGCHLLAFYIEPGSGEDWKDRFKEEFEPLAAILESNEVKPVLRLSTPSVTRGLSLKKWRAMEPQDWRDLLSTCPGLTLSFSPADCIWLGIDYLQVLADFTSAIEHVAAHDVEINRDILRDSGMFGPLWWRYRLAGKGTVDWRQLIELLKLYDYQGAFSIQLDDEFVADEPAVLEDALDEGVRTIAPLVRG